MNVLAPGSQVVGRYRVVRILGAGGMGTVVEATHLQLAQRVAIKFLLPNLCSQRDAVTRFLREARATVQIESEHVARVTDVGTTDDGVPFLVMEYLEGLDLSQLLQREKRLPIAQVVSMVVQACDAIAEAHALGIIHRFGRRAVTALVCSKCWTLASPKQSPKCRPAGLWPPAPRPRP